MAIFDLYSKRKTREGRSQADVFTYDKAPDTLRIQIVHFYNDAYLSYERGLSTFDNFRLDGRDFDGIKRILCREYGVLNLAPAHYDAKQQLKIFIQESTTEQFIDCVELLGKLIQNSKQLEQIAKNRLINEINFRFREAGLGYEFLNDIIVRVDSTVLHSEVVKPAIFLLSSDNIYAGAEQELFSAFDHYRKGENKEAITNSLKAFESCMKAILERRGWAYSPNDTASKLLSICFANNLIPSYMQTHFNSLKSLLESGVPTVRNKTSGHGQGATPIKVPDHLVSYVLHTATANIKLLIESEKCLP